MIGAVFVICSTAMLAGKLFLKWPIDAITVALFLIVWIPAILPTIRRLKFKDLAKGIVKIAPTDIRIRHSSKRINDKYFRVSVRLDAPEDFLELVESVKYERHPTFPEPFKIVDKAPFQDVFRCWGAWQLGN